MSTNKKRVLAGVLFLSALGVWIPQLLGQGGERTAHRDPLDPELAGYPELPPAAYPAHTQRPRPAASSDAPGPHASPAGPPAGPAAGETRTPAALAPGGNFAGEPEPELLGRLARAWSEVGAGLASGLDGGPPRPSGSPGPWPARSSALEEAQAYLARHPLSGILHGSERALALFGARVARPGDELIPGKLAVLAIGRRHVELELPDQVLRVELPPIAARPAPQGAAAAAGSALPSSSSTQFQASSPSAGSQQP